MAYNPIKHHRRSIRLKGYDYAQAGLYFITICTQNRVCLFGDVINGEMILNQYGQIAYNEWLKTPQICHPIHPHNHHRKPLAALFVVINQRLPNSWDYWGLMENYGNEIIMSILLEMKDPI